MKITILGCGTSVGVPALGAAGWGRCNPEDPRNRRKRCAVLVETGDTTILVDAGPDIREQLLPLNVTKIDALLITHTHSDHVAGLDELRAYYWPDRIELPVYATKQHGEDIIRRFPYLFEKKPDSPSYFVPPLTMYEITAGDVLSVKGCEIKTYFQEHGNTFSVGYKFDRKFAYSTDVSKLTKACLDDLAGIPLWVVESLRPEPHSAHAHYEQTFAWISQVKPGRAFLTHLGLEADYETLLSICPENTEPAIDGMQLFVE